MRQVVLSSWRRTDWHRWWIFIGRWSSLTSRSPLSVSNEWAQPMSQWWRRSLSSQQQNKKEKVGYPWNLLRRPDFRHVPLLGRPTWQVQSWVPGAFEAPTTCGCWCIACGPLFLFINPSAPALGSFPLFEFMLLPTPHTAGIYNTISSYSTTLLLLPEAYHVHIHTRNTHIECYAYVQYKLPKKN
jgi:hypothetical protein